MPRRPRAHIIGDQALTQVEQVCLRLGWACERIHQDYGEDLLVQITHDHDLTPLRLLIQVKGVASSREERPDETPAIRVSRAHVKRWILSDTPVMLVRWDITQHTGHWILPAAELADDEELFWSGDKTVRVRFRSDQRFTVQQLRGLAWRFWAQRVATAVATDPFVQEDARMQPSTYSLILDLLIALGLVDQGSTGDIGIAKHLRQSLLREIGSRWNSTSADRRTQVPVTALEDLTRRMLRVANSDAVTPRGSPERMGRDEAMGHVIAILALSGLEACEDALLEGLISTTLRVFEEKIGPDSCTSTFHYGICMVLRGLWTASVPADLVQAFRRTVDHPGRPA
jgi:hypothetical protein